MAVSYVKPPVGQLPKPKPMPIRVARERFGALIDEVAEGSYVLICRRSTPLAVIVPADDYDRMAETFRREEEIAAILRAQGFSVEPWTTPTVLEVVVRLLDGRHE